MEIFLTIGIPLYNNADLIKECLDSIYDQNIDLGEVEVLVVNDGSTDGGEKIVEGYALTHPNLILINKVHEGAPKARNMILDRCRGRYLHFVDSDDCLEKDSYSRIMGYAKSFLPDLLHFDTNHNDNFGKTACHTSPVYYADISDYVSDMMGFGLQAWRKWISTDIIKHYRIRFQETHLSGQDASFYFPVTACAGNALYVPVKVYNYRINPHSLSHSRTMEAQRRFVTSHLLFLTYAKQYIPLFAKADARKCLNHFIYCHYVWVMQLAFSSIFPYTTLRNIFTRYRYALKKGTDCFTSHNSLFSFLIDHPLLAFFYVRIHPFKQ